jgi:alkanesulfonate monooxygenase SsuD/methylene tetrahydromethanopterin reductase-like flavin-dependent oxidoreductase (luciferase family)
VEFGVALPGRGPMASPDQVLKIAAKADALGYASIFVTDHVVLPASMARSVYPYSTTGQLPGGAAQDYLEPIAMLACLARVTSARAWAPACWSFPIAIPCSPRRCSRPSISCPVDG